MLSFQSPKKRILIVTVKSVEVDGDYETQHGLQIDDDLYLEATEVEITARQQDGRKSLWVSTMVNADLENVSPFKYFLVWATHMLSNVQALQEHDVVIRFMEKVYMVAAKIRNSVVAQTLARKNGDNPWLVNYKTEPYRMKKDNIPPHPWSKN